MTDEPTAARYELGRWHLGRPPSPGGVIYVSDSKTGIPDEGTACFSVFGHAADDTEALAQWLLDQLHARDTSDGKTTP